MRLGAAILISCAVIGVAFGGDVVLMKSFLEAPAAYANFERRLTKTGTHDCGEFVVEEYRQANGPRTWQRVQMTVPKLNARKLPAVVVPYYFPEGMLGFNPKDGSAVCGPEVNGQNLVSYRGVSFMADLARRGYVAISADAYHLTYAREGAPSDLWKKWRHAGEALKRDWPGWTGIGKLAFDTRLLVDVLENDARVDRTRIGIMGHSLGGKMAFYAGCLDPRIKVVVASDFGMGWNQTNWRDVWYWGDKLEELQKAGLDNSDLLKIAQTKAFMLIAGKYDNQDSRCLMEKAATGTTGILPVAATGGQLPDARWVFLNHATGHRPPPDAVELAYRFLNRWLNEGEQK